MKSHKIINMLIENKAIIKIENSTQFLIGEALLDMIQESINLNCITSYCVDMPIENAKSGIVPSFEGETQIIKNGVVEELSFDIAKKPFELKELVSFIAINNTAQKLGYKNLMEIVAKFLAESIKKTLNGLAYASLVADTKVVKRDTIQETTIVEDLIEATCLQGRIYANKKGMVKVVRALNNVEMVDDLFPRDHQLFVLLEGLGADTDSVVLISKDNSLAYMHSNEMTIDEQVEIRNGCVLARVCSESDIAVLNADGNILYTEIAPVAQAQTRTVEPTVEPTVEVAPKAKSKAKPKAK